MDETILALAVVGSRARGFNHDAASKLQRLMMATSELEELTPNASPDTRLAIESLQSAIGELEALFSEFRQLARGVEPVPVVVADVLARAAARASVTLAPDLALEPGATAMAREIELVQVLSQLFDALAADPLPITGRRVDGRIELAIRSGGRDLAQALALVTHAVGRTGGSVTRDDAMIRVTL